MKFVKKLKGLLKQLNFRGYLYHFGQKKFKFFWHAFALLIKESLRCSLHWCAKILKMFNVITLTYFVLCKSKKRILINLWNSLLKIIAGLNHKIITIDSTGFSRTNSNFHYLNKISCEKSIKKYAKLSTFFDLSTDKVTVLE